MKKTLIATLFAGAALCACNTRPENTAANSINPTGQWTIIQANGLCTDSAETQPFIVFSDSGTVHGNASVNTFFGQYTVKGDSIFFEQMGATTRMGEDMSIEMAIMQALGQSTTLEIENGVANIKDAQDNTIMTLKRNSSSIVEE